MRRQRFDHWVSFRGQGHCATQSQLHAQCQWRQVKQKGYITDELTDYAIEFMEQQQVRKLLFPLPFAQGGARQFHPAERHAGRYTDAKWERPSSEANTPANTQVNPVGSGISATAGMALIFPITANWMLSGITSTTAKRFCRLTTALVVSSSSSRRWGSMRKPL